VRYQTLSDLLPKDGPINETLNFTNSDNMNQHDKVLVTQHISVTHCYQTSHRSERQLWKLAQKSH